MGQFVSNESLKESQIEPQIDQQIGLLVQKDIFIKIAKMALHDENAFLGMWLSCKWAYNNIELKRMAKKHLNSLFVDNFDKHLREKPQGYRCWIVGGEKNGKKNREIVYIKYSSTRPVENGACDNMRSTGKTTYYELCDPCRGQHLYTLSHHADNRGVMKLGKNVSFYFICELTCKH